MKKVIFGSAAILIAVIAFSFTTANSSSSKRVDLVWFKVDLATYPSETATSPSSITKLIRTEYNDADLDNAVDANEYTLRSANQAITTYSCPADTYKCAYGFNAADLVVNATTHKLEPSSTAVAQAFISYDPE